MIKMVGAVGLDPAVLMTSPQERPLCCLSVGHVYCQLGHELLPQRGMDLGHRPPECLLNLENHDENIRL
jgi:hypothetical protein